jgi:very-short-patch-repair endonuclease
MTRTRSLIPRAKTLRRNATPEENLLWHAFLKRCTPRIKRQRPMDGFILDFYCPKLRLCIELDGAQHFTPEGLERDRHRTAHLELHGVKVVRFTNAEVRRNLRGVTEMLEGIGLEVPLRLSHGKAVLEPPPP